MIYKDILQLGNPFLTKKSIPVKDFASPSLRLLVTDLIETMRFHDLVGISASQIGKKQAIFVTEIRKTQYRNPKKHELLRVFINPQIVKFSKSESIQYEGCGSVAFGQLFGPVKRPQRVTIQAYDQNGKEFILNADSLQSRVIQHEYDHLVGIEFTQKITDYSKMMSVNEYRKRILNA